MDSFTCQFFSLATSSHSSRSCCVSKLQRSKWISFRGLFELIKTSIPFLLTLSHPTKSSFSRLWKQWRLAASSKCSSVRESHCKMYNLTKTGDDKSEAKFTDGMQDSDSSLLQDTHNDVRFSNIGGLVLLRGSSTLGCSFSITVLKVQLKRSKRETLGQCSIMNVRKGQRVKGCSKFLHKWSHSAVECD